MKKYVLIMIIGTAIFAMNMSVNAEDLDTIQRIDSKEVSSDDGLIDEPIIEPVEYNEEGEDLIIAPNPEAVIEHNAEDGERSIDDLENEELIDSALGDVDSKVGLDNKSLGIQLILIVAVVAGLFIALIVFRKKN